MLHALQSELFRLRKRPQTWIMPILATLFIGAFYAVLYLVYQFASLSATDRADMRDSLKVSTIFENGMGIFGFFGGILIVIVASSLIGSEFGWNTLRPLVARARSRSSLLSAKWVVVFAYTVLMVIVGIVASMVIATVGSALVGNSISFSAGLWDFFVLGALRWVAASLPYAVIAFAVALITRSNAAGIAIGIGLSFVEPLLFGLLGLISDVFGTVQEYGIAWNVQQLSSIALHGESSAFGDPVSTAQVWQSAGILAIYVAIFVAASFIVFNRRDITSG
jgi:ABC-type transport system involved in multi-copper enzyme maturation permease subunit